MTTNQIEEGSARLLLTVLEAAERLAVGRSTVYELTATGELELVHIGRCARIPAARCWRAGALARWRAGGVRAAQA